MVRVDVESLHQRALRRTDPVPRGDRGLQSAGQPPAASAVAAGTHTAYTEDREYREASPVLSESANPSTRVAHMFSAATGLLTSSSVMLSGEPMPSLAADEHQPQRGQPVAIAGRGRRGPIRNQPTPEAASA